MSTHTEYFSIQDDVYIRERWHLKSPVDGEGGMIVPGDLMDGVPVSFDKPWFLALMRPGHELDYSLTGLNIPVVSQRFVTLFESLGVRDEVQFIPARVENHSGLYFVLNPLRIVKCIDVGKCAEVAFWEPKHGEPELVGQYRNVRGLRIDPAKAGNTDIFRPWGWPIAIIVSKRIKMAIEEEDLVGPTFTEV